MARTKRTSTSDVETVTLSFDLLSLPTAQHKAGLAGLLLQIRSMEDRKKPPEEVPRIVDVKLRAATVCFTEASMQGLFDDLYDAAVVEVAVKQKWSDEKPKREEEIEEVDAESGDKKRSKRYIYDVVQPRGHFLGQHYPDGDGAWLKLWRDMLWSVPRARPTTRRPYQDRAAGRPCSEGAAMWKELLAFKAALAKNTFRTCEVAGPLLLGAQAVNAESVPFRGRVDETLLLHFWPLVAMIFVPQQIDRDGGRAFVGYTLAIPEVSLLDDFLADYPLMLHDLLVQIRGYRPDAAVIDIPQQAGLEFLENLAQLAEHAARKKRVAMCVSSIEYLHLLKQGNNVKSLAAGRIVPNPRLLDQYLAIVGPDRHRFRNPLFRSGMLLALLEGGPWHRPLRASLVERPWYFFVRDEKTPESMRSFAPDAGAKFRESLEEFRATVEDDEMNDPKSQETVSERPKPPLEILIFRLVRTYVLRKTEEKCGLKWENFEDKKVVDPRSGKERVDVPKEYVEARQKVASDAFLALRSRREQDFVDYFTASVCSVGQFLREDEFRVVAESLLRNAEDVKTLTLLALSANS